jgi:hypothetical protein
MVDKRLLVCAILFALVAVGCHGKVPYTRVIGPVPENEQRVIYVTAERERDVVLQQLEKAGFTIVSEPSESPARLDVRMGTPQARRSCGRYRNLVFNVSRGGIRVVVIKARGWTGSCEPNMLLEMSHELARVFYQQQ